MQQMRHSPTPISLLLGLAAILDPRLLRAEPPSSEVPRSAAPSAPANFPATTGASNAESHSVVPTPRLTPLQAPPTASFPIEPAETEATRRPAPTPPPAASRLPAAAASSPPPVASTAPAAPAVERRKSVNAPTPLRQSHPFESPPLRSDESAPGPARPPEDGAHRDGSEGIFGPIRLGPMIGVGLPDLLNFGGLLKLTRYFALGVNMGIIPTMRISYYGDATLSFQQADVFGRVHPFGGGFFLGAGIGYATVKGTKRETFDTSSYTAQLPANLGLPSTVTYESQGTVKTMVLTPQIGYFYTTDIGFSIGFDFGAQVPVAPSQITVDSQLKLPASTPAQLVSAVRTQLLDPSDAKVKDTLQSIARTPIPTFNFRIGWLF
jgi:hypothetical protein